MILKGIKNQLPKIICLVVYIVFIFIIPELLRKPIQGIITEENSDIIVVLFQSIPYLIIFIVTIILLRKELITDFKNIEEQKSILPFLLVLLVALILTYIGNFVGTLISTSLGGSTTSENQAAINATFSNKYFIILMIDLCIIGPIVEELIFRKSITDILRQFKVPSAITYVIVAVLFGFLHVVSSGDYIQIFPYLFMGLTIGGVELFTKSIYPSIVLHIMINTIASVIGLMMQRMSFLIEFIEKLNGMSL